MSLAASVTTVLNSTIKATKEVIPLNISIGKPSLTNAPMQASSYSVLIGVTGDTKGRLIIETDEQTINKAAQSMYGMYVEGEMLASFFGELGNMIAGKICTFSYENGVTLDITPPTVMLGETTMYGFKKALKLPIFVDGFESTCILLALET